MLAVAIAAAVFAVANVASTGNGSAVSPAQAQILRHVSDALAWPPLDAVQIDIALHEGTAKLAAEIEPVCGMWGDGGGPRRRAKR